MLFLDYIMRLGLVLLKLVRISLIRAQMSTLKAEIAVTLCRRHRLWVMNRWFDCWWREGRMSTPRTDIGVTLCRWHPLRVMNQSFNCCWRGAEIDANITTMLCRRGHRMLEDNAMR